MLTEAPAAFIASISSGVATMAWMICMSLPSRPALPIVSIWPTAAREPLACTEIGKPSLRAASISACVDLRRNRGRRLIAAHAAPSEAERDQAVVGIVCPVAMQPFEIGKVDAGSFAAWPCVGP